MRNKNITIISFGSFEINFLNLLSEEITNSFHSIVEIKESHIDLSNFYNSNRNQYNANDILLYIENRYAKSNTKTIALLNVDLFIPIFTYIFGQAYLNGNSAIASAFRLRNERYGLKSDKSLFFERLLKEMIHELGHAFGLIHCFIPDCVMRAGTYVEDIDQKTSSFCPKCMNAFSDLTSN